MTHKWKLASSENIYRDRWSTVVKKTYESGDNADPSYIVLEKPEFVLMAAVDQSRNLVLVRQYRHGADCSFWALPGGYIEASETPEAAAKRELLEETGFIAKRTSYLGVLHPIPAFLRTKAHIVLCEDLQKDSHAVIDSEIEASEAVPLETVVQKILAGELHEMQAVATILLVSEYLRRRNGGSGSSLNTGI